LFRQKESSSLWINEKEKKKGFGYCLLRLKNKINAKKIITRKLTKWKHEDEYRFLIKSEEKFIPKIW